MKITRSPQPPVNAVVAEVGSPDHKVTRSAEFVVIARLVRPQGRRGEILADILTDFPEKFAERHQLWISAENQPRRELQLESSWMHKGRVVLKFAGIDSIDDAKRLAGMLVEIPRSQRTALEGGAIYIGDLVGSQLIDVAGGPASIGIVEDVEQAAAGAPLLLVRKGNATVGVPFAAEYMVRFDADRRVLEMKLPAGLLEINAPLTDEEKKQQSGKPSPLKQRDTETL